MLALPPTYASIFGALLRRQSIVFRSSTQASRSSSRGTPTFGSPFSRSVVHDRLMHLSCLLCRRSCSLLLWCSGNFPISQLTVVPLWTLFSQHQLSHATSQSTLVPIAVHLHLSVASCLLPTTCGVPAISTFTRPLFFPNQPTPPPPCPVCVTGQLWSALVTTVSLWGTSLSWSTFHAHSPTSLHVRPLWSLSSAPSPKSSSTVHPFAHDIAPPCLVHARGNFPGGMMLGVMPLLLATAPGVTSVALGHKRIRLVSASCASRYTAQSVPPGPTSGTSGLVL